MKRTLTAAGLVALAVATATPALAATAYMDGVGNVGPKWSTITAPGGQTCGVGCSEIRYDYISTQSAARNAGAWMDAHNTPDDVLFVYSLSSTGAIDARKARPDWQGTIVALGSPAKPYNGANALQGGRPPLDVGGGPVDFVTVQGDSVALPGTSGSSVTTHRSGYDGRNFAAETPVSDTQVTPTVRDRVYAKPPSRSWLASLFTPKTTRAAARFAAAAPADAGLTAGKGEEGPAEHGTTPPASSVKLSRAEKRAQARAERAAAARKLPDTDVKPPASATAASPSPLRGSSLDDRGGLS